MKVFLTILFLIITGSLVNSDRTDDDVNACMIKMIKDKGLIDEDFPYRGQPRSCFLVQTILSSMEDGFYSRFDDKKEIKVNCVKSELKKNNFVILAMKKEVIESSQLLSRENINKMLEKNKNDMQKVLNNAAVACQSDPTWSGIFDEILGITNTSQVVLEQKYCLLKISIDKNLIKVGDFDINPHKIDTTNVDCSKILEDRKAEIDQTLRDEYEKKGLPNNSVECVIRNFRSSRFYDVTIAIECLEKNDFDPAVRAENKERLAPQLQSGISGLFSCFMLQSAFQF